MNLPILSLVIWTPIFAGIAVLFAGDRNPGAARILALLGAIAGVPLRMVSQAASRRNVTVPRAPALKTSLSLVGASTISSASRSDGPKSCIN